MATSGVADALSLLSSLPPALLHQIPALQPPQGIQSNFINPPTQGPIFVIYASIVLGFVLFFYAIRVYTKTFIVRQATWDDLTCTLGLVGVILNYVVYMYGIIDGPYGKHQWDVPLADMVSKKALVTDYVAETLVFPPLALIKLSFFLFYLQVFWPQRWFRLCVYFGAAFNCVFYTAATATMLALTTPRSNETWISHGVGSDQSKAIKFTVASSAVGFAIDVYLIGLPIRAVFQLQLPLRKKIGASVMFLTGLIACVCSILTLYYRHVITQNPDLTWIGLTAQIVVMTEMYAGLICLCLPPLSRLLSYHNLTLSSLHSRMTSPMHSSQGTKTVHNGAKLDGAEISWPIAADPCEKQLYNMPGREFSSRGNDSEVEFGVASVARFELPKVKRLTPMKEIRRSWYLDSHNDSRPSLPSEKTRDGSDESSRPSLPTERGSEDDDVVGRTFYSEGSLQWPLRNDYKGH